MSSTGCGCLPSQRAKVTRSLGESPGTTSEASIPIVLLAWGVLMTQAYVVGWLLVLPSALVGGPMTVLMILALCIALFGGAAGAALAVLGLVAHHGPRVLLIAASASNLTAVVAAIIAGAWIVQQVVR